MQQLLSGLDHCHSRGVLHRDIKGSNLLIDNNGILKIADFGLATSYDPHHSVPLTSRVVTLWYRPPELLLGASHYGVAVDLWSTGCILGELYSGKPILPGKTEVPFLGICFHKILAIDAFYHSLDQIIFKVCACILIINCRNMKKKKKKKKKGKRKGKKRSHPYAANKFDQIHILGLFEDWIYM